MGLCLVSSQQSLDNLEKRSGIIKHSVQSSCFVLIQLISSSCKMTNSVGCPLFICPTKKISYFLCQFLGVLKVTWTK